MKVRFAVSAGAGRPDPAELKGFVTVAERLGFDTLWFSDLPVLPSTDPMLSVAMAAAWTERIKLGVNLVPFGYEPFVFARQVAQLDRLSGGRLLLTIVPGLDQPGERGALGIGKAHRGNLLDDLIPKLRSFWAGDTVGAGGAVEASDASGAGGGVEAGDASGAGGGVEAGSAPEEIPALPTTPLQDPLEIWLGGSGPEAVVRAGRLSDGWLGSLMTPARAEEIKVRIEQEATAAGRTIDPEHFGLSIGYAREKSDLERTTPIRRRPPVDLSEVVPIGRQGLRDLVGDLIDSGLSKFVVRRIAPASSSEDELAWLADSLLDLQT
ncbi:MAG TPA: LLM class flavin-dependent oxidoreductase [Acidimicrobiales bacterium]